MPEPTPTNPTPPTPAPADPTPPVDPAAPPVDDFTSERERTRFAELTSRLQERETERDQARQRLEALQWAEAERLASAVLAQGADLRLQTPDLAALLDDTGAVSAEKVAAAAAALVAARPGFKLPTAPRPLPGGSGLPPSPAKPTLADVFRRATGGDRL
jgi:hypothetical protein